MKEQYSRTLKTTDHGEKTHEALAFISQRGAPIAQSHPSLETSVTRLKIGENFYFGLIFPPGLRAECRGGRMKGEAQRGDIDTG